MAVEKYGTINREKFYDELGRAINNNKIVYIGCPTGWGKTTATLNCLEETKQEYLYASACDEKFLKVLDSSKYNEAKLVVLDDLYNLERKEDTDLLVEHISKSTAKHILISRTELPPYLKPFHITMQLSIFGVKDLAFSYDETAALIRLHGIDISIKDCKEITDRMKGWAVAISIIAARLQNEAYSEDVFGLVKWDVFDYFDAILFENWSEKLQMFLMDICDFDELDVKLVSMVTGMRDADKYLQYCLSIDSFIKFIPPNNYTFISLQFREYLQKKRHELCTEEHIKHTFQNAGLFYELEDDLPNAMKYYSKSGNLEKLSELLIENSNHHASNAQFYDTEKYYRSLPKKMIIKSPELMCAMSMMESLYCNPEESEQWYKCLENYKDTVGKETEGYKIAREKLVYLDIGLPHRGSVKVFELIRKSTELCISGKMSLQEISVTGNKPSLMNGGKDFTDWTKKDRKIYSILKRPVEVVFGKCGVGLADGAMGESLFEKSTSLNFTDSLSYLNKGLSSAMLKGTNQMLFAIIGTMARIFIAQGSLDTAIELVDNFRTRCITEKERTILPDIEAVRVRMNLVEGERYGALRWMKYDAPNELDNFYIMSRYEYLTKVRCYILIERYAEGQSLLNLLKIYYQHYGRPYGVMETQMLYAIILYRIDDDRWQEEMSSVIHKCEEYQFTRLIADEGVAVYKLLQKLDYDGDKKFYRILLKLSREQAIKYPDYLVPKNKLKSKLTQNEEDVLSLIVQGKKNNEIGEFLSISVSTVKFHSSNIYAKLGVSNRAQAIKTARELNLV